MSTLREVYFRLTASSAAKNLPQGSAIYSGLQTPARKPVIRKAPAFRRKHGIPLTIEGENACHCEAFFAEAIS